MYSANPLTPLIMRLFLTRGRFGIAILIMPIPSMAISGAPLHGPQHSAMRRTISSMNNTVGAPLIMTIDYTMPDSPCCDSLS